MTEGEVDPAEREERLARLFLDFLAADERGEDREQELLQAAGEERETLAARIRLHRMMGRVGAEDGAHEANGEKQRFGRFEILDVLGEGGFSRVLLAFDPKLGRRVALKLIERTSLLDRSEGLILNEARSLAAIAHPGVVEVYDYGEAGPRTYVAMELLTGPSLAEVIAELARRRAGGAPPSAQASNVSSSSTAVRALADQLGPYSRRIELLAGLADALAHCHDRDVLHRDVKPRNVLFDAEGRAKFIDFGLAHVAGEGSRLDLTQKLVGTPAYLAPEQVTSKRTGADPRSDQFSFATLAYELCALRNPFEHGTQLETSLAVEAADPPSLAIQAPAVPPDLALVIRNAHSRDPAGRYSGMAALAADLRAILANRPVSVEEPSLVHVARLWLRRHRRGVRVAGASVVAVLTAVGLLWQYSASQEQRDILARLARIRPHEFVGPEPFDASLGPLLDLKPRARAFDESSSSLFRADLSPAVNRTIHAWADHLGKNYARQAREGLETGRSLQEILYRQLFAKEEVLCPECTENLEFRQRGTVQLPSEALRDFQIEVQMLACRVDETDMYSHFVRTEPAEYPLPGTYRLLAWKPGGERIAFESLYSIERGWPPAVELVLIAPRNDIWEAARPFERQGHALARPGWQLRVPSFRMLPRLVTMEEFMAFERATGLHFELADREIWPPDAPACTSLHGAMAFATWAGGRLPLSQELLVAEKAQAIKLEADFLVGGEYLLDLDPGRSGNHQWLAHTALKSSRLQVVNEPDRSFLIGDNPPKRAGFRVAFTTDSPGFLRDVEATALEPVPRK